MTIEEAFGTVIRRFRKERQLSQDELSKISSLDRVFISQIERGKQQPTLVTIFELAAALNLPVATILSETELLLSFHETKPKRHDFNAIPYKKLWEKFGGELIPDDSEISCKETILLVDDELHLCQFLFELLTSRGYNLIIAMNGQDAVDKYKTNLGSIDLVLMDVLMPVKDGVTANREIVKLDPNAKVLLMSSYPTISTITIENLNCIGKPLFPTILLNSIRTLLDSDEATYISAAETQPVLS
jgi:transcriptional regulator with XRE-family HTH domain